MGGLFDSKNIFVALTYRCNAFCQKCMTRYHVNRAQEMSPKLIEVLCAKLQAANYSGWISLGSGETLLYPHLAYFLSNLLKASCGSFVRILSNGQSFTKDLPPVCFDRRCKWGITFDGFVQSSLDNLQWGVCLDEVKEHVAEAAEVYGGDRLYLNFTLHNRNYPDLIEYCKFAASLDIREVYVTELRIFQGFETALEEYRLRRTEDFYRVLEEAKRVLFQHNITVEGLDVDRRIHKSGCFLRNAAGPMIDVDGALSFCSGREDVIIGNIQDSDIEQKWSEFKERLSTHPEFWCRCCHDRTLEGGIYSLPKTIQPECRGTPMTALQEGGN